MSFYRVLKYSLAILLGLVGLFFLLVYALNFQPADLEAQAVHCRDEVPQDAVPRDAVPVLQAGQTIKVLSWNVQFMAGTDTVFFFEVKSGQVYGKPSHEDIEHTLSEVARVIGEENPDVILLEEVDDGAARTFHEDQLQRLLALLNSDYRCHASAFYWKSAFIPHPDIMGSAGMKLSVISKYKMTEAWRHQLALIPESWVWQQFNLKRAVLEVHLPVIGASDLVVFNTHLAAFAHGTGTLEKQAGRILALLEEHTLKGTPWILGGDLNMLPPGLAYERLRQKGQDRASEELLMKEFYERYQVVPTLDLVNGVESAQWRTSFSKGSDSKELDKTNDYLILSNSASLLEARVRQGAEMIAISDHMPLLVNFQIPEHQTK